MNITLKQCRLIKEYANTQTVKVYWLPEKIAVVGKTVKIKINYADYDDGWKISEVYGKMVVEESFSKKTFS